MLFGMIVNEGLSKHTLGYLGNWKVQRSFGKSGARIIADPSCLNRGFLFCEALKRKPCAYTCFRPHLSGHVWSSRSRCKQTSQIGVSVWDRGSLKDAFKGRVCVCIDIHTYIHTYIHTNRKGFV